MYWMQLYMHESSLNFLVSFFSCRRLTMRWQWVGAVAVAMVASAQAQYSVVDVMWTEQKVRLITVINGGNLINFRLLDPVTRI